MEDRLQKFAALVEAGSFTKAAQYLHISQPALSVSIDKLERSLKTKLIESSGRGGIVLTKAGQAVYAAALEHRAIEHNLMQRLQSVRQQKPPLRIGMIDNVASLLSAADEPLRTLEHQTELGLFVANSSSLRTALQTDRLDVAIVVSDEENDASMQRIAAGTDRLVLVCEVKARARLQSTIDRGQPLSFISYVQASKTYQLVATALEDAHIRTNTLLYSTSPDVMLRTTLRGRGAALLPENLVSIELKKGSLEQLHVGRKPYAVERRLSVLTLKGRQLPDAASSLIQYFERTF